jgi:hypothetical protein
MMATTTLLLVCGERFVFSIGGAGGVGGDGSVQAGGTFTGIGALLIIFRIHFGGYEKFGGRTWMDVIFLQEKDIRIKISPFDFAPALLDLFTKDRAFAAVNVLVGAAKSEEIKRVACFS